MDAVLTILLFAFAIFAAVVTLVVMTATKVAKTTTRGIKSTIASVRR